jgi:hypothetical protein
MYAVSGTYLLDLNAKEIKAEVLNNVILGLI